MSLSDGLGGPRPPTLHAATHLPGGIDPVDIAGTVVGSGVHASRPAASASNAGCLYFETDTTDLFRSDGATWTQVAQGTGDGLASSRLTGTIPAAWLGVTGTTALAGNTAAGGDATGTLGNLTVSGVTHLTGSLPAGVAVADGSLSAVSASKLTGSHTLPDGTLSTNVPLLNVANTFTGVITSPGLIDSARLASTCATLPTAAYGAGSGTNPGQYTITGAVPSDSNTTATITTSATHGYSVGSSVVIASVTGTGTSYNGTFTITATPSNTTFKYALASAGTYTSGGTATVSVPTLATGSNDVAGQVIFGTGGTNVAGVQVVLTYGSSTVHKANSLAFVMWANSAGGNTTISAESISNTGFSIRARASLGNNIQVNNYAISYLVVDTQ